MKAKDALIAWTPQSWTEESSAGGVRVLDRQVVFGDDGFARYQWDKPYQMTDGAVLRGWSRLSRRELATAILRIFNTLVIRDGLKPDVVHDALLVIDEYATSIDPDTRGARDPD